MKHHLQNFFFAFKQNQPAPWAINHLKNIIFIKKKVFIFFILTLTNQSDNCFKSF